MLKSPRMALLALAAFASVPFSSVLAQDVVVPQDLAGRWVAEDILGGGVIDDLQTTLEIDRAGTYHGFGGCNAYRGSLKVDESRISFGPPAATRKMCAPAVMDQETRFFQALQTMTSWSAGSGLLLLQKDGSEEGLRLSSMPSGAEVSIKVPNAEKVDRRTVVYRCGEESVTADYIEAGSVSLAVLAIGKEFVVASNVVSGSGARYAGDRYIWWTKGEEASLLDVTKGSEAQAVPCKGVSDQ